MGKNDTSDDRIQSAARLRSIRDEFGMTQEEFAEILGISVSAYKKLESGENQVSISSLKNLRARKNVSSDYILYGDEPDLDGVWTKIANCSEMDKFILFFRLFKHFTNDKFVTSSLNYKDMEEQAFSQLVYMLHKEVETEK